MTSNRSASASRTRYHTPPASARDRDRDREIYDQTPPAGYGHITPTLSTSSSVGRTRKLTSGKKFLPTSTVLSTPRMSPPPASGAKGMTWSFSCDEVIPSTELRYAIPVGDKMWCAERAGTITVRDNRSAAVTVHIPNPEVVEFCWCLLYFSNFVWAGFSSGYIRLYDPEEFRVMRELRQHAGGVYFLQADISSNSVFSASEDFECLQWNASSHEFVRQFSGHTNWVRCVAVRAIWLYSGSSDHSIRVYKISTGECVRELIPNHEGVLAMLVCGENLWCGFEDGSICIFDTNSWDLLQTITVHSTRVTAFAKLDQKVWSTGADRAIFIHDVITFAQLGCFLGHRSYVNHLSIVDCSVRYRLWSCSADDTIRVWSYEVPLALPSSLLTFAAPNVVDMCAATELRSRNTSLETQIEALKQKQEESIRTFEQIHRDTNDKLQQAQKVHLVQLSEIRQVEAQLREQLSRKQTELEQSLQIERQLRMDSQRVQESLSRTERMLAHSQESERRLGLQLEHMQFDFSGAQATERQLRADAQVVQNKLIETDKILLQSKESERSLREQVGVLQSELKAAREQINGLRQSEAVRMQELQALTMNLTDLQQREASQAEMLSQLETELNVYKANSKECSEKDKLLRQELNTVTNQLAASKRNEQFLEKELQLVKDENRSLNGSVQHLRESNTQLTEDVSQLRQVICELQDQLGVNSQEKHELITVHTSVQKEWEEVLKQQRAKIAEMQQIIEQLRQQLTESQSENQLLHKLKDAAENAITELRTKSTSQSSFISQLKEAHETLSADLTSVRQEHTKAQAQLVQLDRTVTSKHSDIEKLVETNRAYAEVIRSMEREYNRKIRDMESKRQILMDDMSTLVTKQEEEAKVKVGLLQQINSQNQDLNACRREIEQLRLESQRWAEQVQNCGVELSNKEKDLEKANSQNKTLAGSEKSMSAKAKDLQDLIELQKFQLREFDEKLLGKELEVKALQSQLEESNLNGEQYVAQLKGQNQEVAKLVTQIKSLNKDLLEGRKRIEKLEGLLSSKNMEISKQMEENDVLQENLRKLKQDHSNEMLSAQGKLEEFQSELQSLVDHQKKQVEEKEESQSTFVIQSRAELVKQIWELFCDISDCKKKLKELYINPSYRVSGIVEQKLRKEKETVWNSVLNAKARNRSIISNFFTDVEKWHIGISPHDFKPDEGAIKYHIPDSLCTLETVKRMASKQAPWAGFVVPVPQIFNPLADATQSAPSVGSPSGSTIPSTGVSTLVVSPIGPKSNRPPSRSHSAGRESRESAAKSPSGSSGYTPKSGATLGLGPRSSSVPPPAYGYGSGWSGTGSGNASSTTRMGSLKGFP